MLKKFFKPILAGAIALVVAVSGVAPAVSATSIYDIDLDTGNSRTNKLLEDDEQSYTDFYTAYVGFKNNFIGISDSTPSQSELKEKAADVEVANKKLQATSFALADAPLYEPAGKEVKATAQSLTDLVVSVSNAGVTSDTIGATTAQLDAAYDKFYAALEKLEEGAAAYDPPGAWLAFVIIGGLVAVFATIIVVLVRRSNKKTAARLFGDDPAAQQLSAEQRKFIVRMANDVKSYEQSLSSGNASLITALGMTYQDNKEKGADPALGRYTYLIEEFTALVCLQSNQLDAAKEAAHRAAHIKGDSMLLTAKARGLLS